MSVLMLFIDGIGIGEADESRNPFARFPSPFFSTCFKNEIDGALPFSGRLTATDATMDMPGLPQSATGQTALLTGENAAKVMGRHHPGFPSVTLRRLLCEKSIFLKLEKGGKVATFANAFTPEYFEPANSRRISATTWSVKASSFPFRMVQPELWQGQALSHDLTNEFLNGLGVPAPVRTPEAAAEILSEILHSVDFCLFEYFLTDRIGHNQDMAWAGRELDKLNRFLATLLPAVSLGQNTVILTSDHGNFEDLSEPTHTLNPVPTIVWGRHAAAAAGGISRIEDVQRTILNLLDS